MSKRPASKRRKNAIWVAGGVAVLAWTGVRTVVAAGDAAGLGMAAIRPETIRADMRFLADDLLEGQGTGTRRHEIAAKFVASEFEAMGLV
jgi:hypothetical protein